MLKFAQGRIADIHVSVEQIYDYVEGMSFDVFVTDQKTVDAVLYRFGIIGEAAAKLPDEIRALNPDIEWHKIKAMRNIVIHDYLGVSLTTVWRTIQVSLPELNAQLERLEQQLDALS